MMERRAFEAIEVTFEGIQVGVKRTELRWWQLEIKTDLRALRRQK